MDKSKVLLYYKRPEIQEAILATAKNREVAVRYGKEGGFGKRPDVLSYPQDVLELVKGGATSFHVSEELWKNPLLLRPDMNRRQLNDNRKGWDLVLDIDCDWFEYSSIAADLVIKAIKHNGVAGVSCKFSGNHGFHIGVCAESFPEEVAGFGKTKDLFPEGPRKVAAYIGHLIKDHLAAGILKLEGGIEKVLEKTGKQFEDVVKDSKFDPFTLLTIDTVLIASRHLYRCAYSFNEKSGWVSVPINPNRVLDFKREMAESDGLKISKFGFLESSKAVPNEAKRLIVSAFDFIEPTEKIEMGDSSQKKYAELSEAIPEKVFPPAIKKLLEGLDDGKKRALFVLVNFLSSVGWDYDEIEKRLYEWNEVNKEPLREVYIVSQLRYHKAQGKKILPPNYESSYYSDMGIIITPDEAKFKNPVTFAKRRLFYLRQNEGKKKNMETSSETEKDSKTDGGSEDHE